MLLDIAALIHPDELRQVKLFYSRCVGIIFGTRSEWQDTSD